MNCVEGGGGPGVRAVKRHLSFCNIVGCWGDIVFEVNLFGANASTTSQGKRTLGVRVREKAQQKTPKPTKTNQTMGL